MSIYLFNYLTILGFLGFDEVILLHLDAYSNV